MIKRKTRQTSFLLPVANDNTLSLYLKEIAHNEPLTSKEEAELSVLIRKGDKAAFERLVLANLRFVVSVSHAYQNQGLPVSDLINEGNIGLMRAARRFDEKKNFRFISYAVWWIRQAILQALAEQSRIVRLPLNRVSSIHKIGQAQTRLQQRYHRNASTLEIAEEIGVSETDVQQMLRVGNRHASLDAPHDDGRPDRYDMLPGVEDETTDDAMMHVSLRAEMGRSLAKLDKREKEILLLYFGIGHDMAFTLEEIGQRYRLTRERVRQIKEKALSKLKLPSVNGRLRVFAQQP
jgi:RNA polymerase primary sigma factor